jgi:basic amino acid/polyamine antiporter, APA family
VSQAEAPAAVPKSGLFARTATGLVRGVPPRSSLIINFIPGHPTQTMVAILLFALAAGAGGNPFLALLIVVPMSLSFAYAFGLLTQMIPRSGGDYMLVSRVIHPAIGYVSVFCMTTASLLSNAFFGLAVVTAGITPLCVSVGLIGDWPGLVSWGQHAATSKGWLILFGLLMFAFAGAMQLGGWRWILRLQNLFFWMVTASLAIVTVVTLFQSKDHFISQFNGFVQGITQSPDAYAGTIATAVKNGVAVSPSFSFSATVPMIAVFATTAIFSYWSTFVGGELRQASTIKTANNMALGGVIPLALVAICTAIFFKTFGSDFLRAANGGGLPEEVATPGTTFFYLSGISVGSTAYTLIIFILYIVFWPLITYISSLQPTRAIFAMSFDGVLPKGVTRVNRYGCPDLALAIALLMSAATFVWAVFDQTGFFVVLAYALLVQLIAMALVGLSGVLAPIFRPELYRASASQKRFLGISLVQIAGVGAILTGVFVWWAYLHYDQLGANANLGKLFGWTIGPAVLGAIFFLVVAAVKKNRGTDITLVYREIPPE